MRETINMESSRENDEIIQQPSLFSLSCESGKFSPHIHTEEASAIRFPCKENGRRNTITCKDENLDEFLTEIGTLDMNTAHMQGADFPFAEQIPVIPRSFFGSPPTLVSQEMVGISLSDIFVNGPLELRDGQYRVCKNLKINTDVLRNPVFRNKKVILMSDARDTLLEHLWWDRDDFKLFETLAGIGFYAVTTPNFSLFKGECPIGHAWNIKKGLICGVELEKLGVTVIPHIYAVHQRQLERWHDWLQKHPSVKNIAMNCQLQRKSIIGRNIAVAALQYLLVNTDVHILLNGSDKRILVRLKEFKERLHTASSGVFKNMEILKSPQLVVSENFSRVVM